MQGYGNIKLRGKKFKLLRCGCCEAFNCKYEKAVELMQHEIQEYKTDPNSQEPANDSDYWVRQWAFDPNDSSV